MNCFPGSAEGAGGNVMSIETRVAVISIIVENDDAAQKINEILHEYRGYVIGRMGIPYRTKGISIISVAVDAPQEEISALSGKIGRLPGISTAISSDRVLLPASDPAAVIPSAICREMGLISTFAFPSFVISMVFFRSAMPPFASDDW